MAKYNRFEELPVWQEAARLYHTVLDLLEEPGLCAEQRDVESAESAESKRDPESDGPTDGWFTREDWRKGRGRQRWDA